MKAAIIGSTGLTGTALLHRLLEDPSIEEVISVSRRSSGIAHLKLKECLISDLSDLASRSSDLRAELYFNCLGTTIRKAGSQDAFRAVDYDAALEFARIAKSYDAKAFVSISAMGASETSVFFYNRVKGELDRDLRALNLPSLAIFRPALLIGERVEKRMGEQLIVNIARPILKILPNSMSRRVATDIHRLADRMLQVAKAPRQFQIIEAQEI